MLKERYTHEELKNMNDAQRKELSQELRAELLKTVSENGGHLSSNLGVVELTIALHSVFHSPEDVILFDVGHQAYVHKLLTGRSDRFHTLRKKGGLSGFPTRSESVHDFMTTGHSSTAISAALGASRANKLAGNDGAVVVVVGDGAMTGGMCYEALNDAGNEGAPMIVILNDNEMSIAPNVGALTYHLTKLRQSLPYLKIKQNTRSLLSKIPVVGEGLLACILKVQAVIKALFLRDTFFDSLGFLHLGPIDGHDTRSLIAALVRCRRMKRPVLLHVVTQKGRGYRPAEDSPDVFHGTAPFFVLNGEAVDAPEISSGQIAARKLCEFAASDRRIAVITAAMTAGTGMQAFQGKFPDRFFDVGIAEEHAVTMAGGMALQGLKPYVAIYSTFLQRAYDQILLDVCLQNAPVVFLIDRGGLTGADGMTHQGVFDLSFLRHMPGLIVAAPRDVYELERMLELSLVERRPMAIRYPREALDLGESLGGQEKIEVGRWELLVSGDEVMIFAVGRMVSLALKTCIELHGKDIKCGVVDARFIKPMDEKMLVSLSKRARMIVTIEDNVLIGGFGSGVLECLGKHGVAVRTLTLGIPDQFIAQATVREQMEEVGLTTEAVARRIQEALEEENARR